MIMLHLADRRPTLRQNIAVGRVSQRITGRGLAVRSATLFAQIGAGPRLILPAWFAPRSEGYFAFSLLPESGFPDFAGAPAVRLIAEFRLALGTLVTSERVVATNALKLEEATRRIDRADVIVRVVAGAPFDLSIALNPAPVGLQGIIVRRHDPDVPVANVSIAAGAEQAVSDAQGRFFIDTLPVVAETILNLTESGSTTTSHHPHRIDYSRPVNSVTLSLPG